MAQAFLCPNCQASLEYEEGGAVTVRCQYCQTTVIVPPELRPTMRGRTIPQGGPGLAEMAEITRLLLDGRKIEAIKLLREMSGLSLQEAKEAVEQLERGRGSSLSGTSPNPLGTTAHPLQPRPAASRFSYVVLAVVVLAMLAAIALPIFLIFFAANSVSESIVPLVGTAAANAEPGLPPPTSTAVPTLTPTPAFAAEVFSFGGQAGTGPGAFNDTRHIGVDGEGRIYTADYQDGRIQAFDSQGNFLAQWLVENRRAPIISMTADRQGRVYVIQQGEIARYDGLSGERQLTIPSPGGAGYRDLAIAADGKLIAYAYQPPDTLYWLDSEGTILQSVPAILSGQTDDPEPLARVAVDGLGNVYLLGEGFTPLVFKFDASGKFITRIGSKGNDLEQLNLPRALAIDNQGWLYVADSNGIDVLTGDGRYLDTIPLRGVTFDMAFSDRNELFLMERNGNRVIQMALQAGAQGK